MNRLTLTYFHERSVANFSKWAQYYYIIVNKLRQEFNMNITQYIKHIDSHTYFHGSSLVSNLAVCKKK